MMFFQAVTAARLRPATGGIVTTNLQIHYDFQNASCYPGSGSIVTDLSGNSRNLTFVNLPTWAGDYFQFDGVNDYGSISNISTVATAGTVGYWIRLNTNLTTSLNQRISGINADWEFGRLDVAGQGVSPGCSPATAPNGAIGFDLGNFLVTHTNATFSFTTSVWANLVVTWNIGGTAITYVNGTQRHSCAPVNNSRTGTWTVGRSPGNTSNYYGGNLGWMVYYDRQLSAAEIVQNFDATKQNYGY